MVSKTKEPSVGAGLWISQCQLKIHAGMSNQEMAIPTSKRLRSQDFILEAWKNNLDLFKAIWNLLKVPKVIEEEDTDIDALILSCKDDVDILMR